MNRIKTIIKYNKKEKIAKLFVALEKRHLKQKEQIKELKERLHNAEKTLIVIDSLHNDSERTSELVHEYFISTDKPVLKK